MIDKLLKLIPSEPVQQARYIYYLTTILFLGLLGYAASAWYSFFMTWQLGALFQGIFMLAGSLLTLTAVKQTRASYQLVKVAYANPQPQKEMKTEGVKEMMDGFK